MYRLEVLSTSSSHLSLHSHSVRIFLSSSDPDEILSVTGLLSLTFTSTCSAVPPSDPVKRQNVLGTATVNLAVAQGTPSHLASGFLYGIPDAANQVPSHFYTDMGFNYARAGGSQLPAPARGWVYGTTEFQVRKVVPISSQLWC
jgi:hypothetical protein